MARMHPRGFAPMEPQAKEAAGSGPLSNRKTQGAGVHAPQPRTDTTATLMLVALGFAWGLTWPAMRIALDEIPPLSMRVVTLVRAEGRQAPRASCRRGNPQRPVVLAAQRDRHDVRRDRPRRDARLYDADLGGIVRLARPRRTLHARTRDCAYPMRGRDGHSDLAARPAKLDHRPLDRDQHRDELGRGHRLCEMGAPHR